MKHRSTRVTFRKRNCATFVSVPPPPTSRNITFYQTTPLRYVDIINGRPLKACKMNKKIFRFSSPRFCYFFR